MNIWDLYLNKTLSEELSNCRSHKLMCGSLEVSVKVLRDNVYVDGHELYYWMDEAMLSVDERINFINSINASI